MRRPFLLVAAMLLVGTAVFLAGQCLVGYYCTLHAAQVTGELGWIGLEFGLNDTDSAHVRQLHEGYLPKCRDFCTRIDAQKEVLRAALAVGTNSPAALERQLMVIGTLRAQCQAAMLQHFRDVSQVMPPEQGRRYLAQMQGLTLGLHEHIEHSMSANSSGPHGRR